MKARNDSIYGLQSDDIDTNGGNEVKRTPLITTATSAEEQGNEHFSETTNVRAGGGTGAERTAAL